MRSSSEAWVPLTKNNRCICGEETGQRAWVSRGSSHGKANKLGPGRWGSGEKGKKLISVR